MSTRAPTSGTRPMPSWPTPCVATGACGATGCTCSRAPTSTATTSRRPPPRRACRPRPTRTRSPLPSGTPGAGSVSPTTTSSARRSRATSAWSRLFSSSSTTPARSTSASTAAGTATAASVSTRERESPTAVSRSPEAAVLHQREELLLPDVEVPGVADQAPREQPGLHPTRALPQRGARLPARAAPGPLDQPADGAPFVGHSLALRRPVRDVRLVRRAYQLHFGPRLPRRRALQGILGGRARRTPDRQGHPEAAWGLLADHAPRRRSE